MFNKRQKLEFHFNDDSFVCKNREYKLADIKAIRFVQSRFDLKIVLVATNSTYQASLIIDMKNGEEIKLKEAERLTKASNKDVVDEIRDIYVKVSEKTFNQRAAAYQQQVTNNGYFHYNGWRCYPSSRVIESDKGTFSLDEYALYKSYGFLEIRPKNPSAFYKIKRQFSSQTIGINTTLDTDVIFPLFKHYFGLAWES